MSPCIRSNKGKNTRVITQISENEYLVEGESNWARFGCQYDPSIITSANLDGGPYLLVNDSFLGKGKITQLQNIETEQDNYFVLKVTIIPYKEEKLK
jgi:hypothetical protein